MTRACNHISLVPGCRECDAVPTSSDLADVPAPVVPALSGRRVARSGEAAAGLVIGEKHALVSADAARAVAVIAGHLDSPERLRRITHDRDYWKRIADDHETRAKATVGPLHEQHVENAADAKAWADFYAAILSVHVPSVEPTTKEPQ